MGRLALSACANGTLSHFKQSNQARHLRLYTNTQRWKADKRGCRACNSDARLPALATALERREGVTIPPEARTFRRR